MSWVAQKAKDKIWVQWRGRLYAVPASLEKARSSAAREQELVAPFSCKVLRIHVKAGEPVAKGQPVAVVEAMKMEYAYSSPRAGTVAKVLVKEGEILVAGAKFVEWKEA